MVNYLTPKLQLCSSEVKGPTTWSKLALFKASEQDQKEHFMQTLTKSSEKLRALNILLFGWDNVHTLSTNAPGF